MLVGEIEAKQMLKEAGVSVTDTQLAPTSEDAVKLCNQFGYPCVLKIVSPDITHKSDSGGVKLNIKSDEEARAAFDEIMESVKKTCPDAKIDGVSVQPMAKKGVEVIIGVSRDDQFGPVVMFGLGGVMVELIKDVSFRVLPITRVDAAEMIQEIKGYKMLTGFRGAPPVDMKALEDILLAVSTFMQQHPEVNELDLNPVFAYEDGVVAVDARIITADDPSVNAPKPFKVDPAEDISFMFNPKSIAIIGASADPNSNGYDYLSHLVNYGFKGEIYPISIKYDEILGLKTYKSLDDVPGDIDYVICCIGIHNVPKLLDDCSKKNVKGMHIFAARATETGRPEAKKLVEDIETKSKEYNIRLIGPNCLGVYNPTVGMGFSYECPKDGGNIGLLAQSGGSSVDLVYSAAVNGVRFSTVVSYGNALDLNEGNLLNYFTNDPNTKVIMCLIEGLRCSGQEFLSLLRKASAKKPVIICKGGMSNAGARATMSHTASLAGSSTVWKSAVRQAGGIPVDDIDDLITTAIGFSLITKPIEGTRIGHGGAGGGRNVNHTDLWENNGFEVVPLPQYVKEHFKELGSKVWDMLDNPADRSIWSPGEVFDVPSLMVEMAKDPNFDLICANMASEEHPYSKESFIEVMGICADGYVKLAQEITKPFFMLFKLSAMGEKDINNWRWQEIAKIRTKLINAGIALFPTVEKAAMVVNGIIFYQKKKKELLNAEAVACGQS